MTRRSFQSAKRPITSNKEVIDAVSLTVAGGTTQETTILTAVNDYTGTVGTCPLGASILGFYVEASNIAVGDGDLTQRIDWLLGYVDGAQTLASLPVPGSSGGHVLRSHVFHEEKGIFPQNLTTGNAPTQGIRTRTFVRVPKRFRRMAEDREWGIRSGSSDTYSVCYKVIYKWYI